GLLGVARLGLGRVERRGEEEPEDRGDRHEGVQRAPLLAVHQLPKNESSRRWSSPVSVTGADIPSPRVGFGPNGPWHPPHRRDPPRRCGPPSQADFFFLGSRSRSTSVGASSPVTTCWVTTTFSTSPRDGTSYITWSRTSSMIARRPRAPV